MTIQPITERSPFFDPDLEESMYRRLSLPERLAHVAYRDIVTLSDISPGTEYAVGGLSQHNSAEAAVDILNASFDLTPDELRVFGRACFYTTPTDSDAALRYIVFKTPDAHSNVYDFPSEH